MNDTSCGWMWKSSKFVLNPRREIGAMVNLHTYMMGKLTHPQVWKYYDTKDCNRLSTKQNV
jgi:hypothetical protein